MFVYDVDTITEPARERRAMTFTEIYLGKVEIADFRKNPRGELGTRTATLHKEGVLKLRGNWIYRDRSLTRKFRSLGIAARATSK